MPIASLDDIDLFYEVSGEGPLLVLVTGLAGVASYWEPNLEALARHFTVLRYDQRGTGRSSRAEGPYSVELLADDLIGLMRHLGLSRASLLGHSTGGAIGQVLTSRHPDIVERLVLYASWASLCPQMRLCMEMRRLLLATAGPAAYHRASPLFLYPPRHVCESWPRIAAELEANVAHSTTPAILAARVEAVLAFDGRPYLRSIAAPTLVLVADDDILTPRFAADELAAALAHAQLKTIAYGAHAVSACEPEAFHAAVLPFLLQGAADASGRRFA
jgi:aminoacrylate hydrolase